MVQPILAVFDCKGTKKNRDLQVYYPNIAEKYGIFRAYFAEK